MSDDETTKPDRPLHNRGWMRFHEKPVLLQLAEPYGAAKAGPRDLPLPASLAEVGGVAPDDPQAGSQAFAQAMPGILYVEPDGSGGVLLVLKTRAANGDATVALHPDMVRFCTMVEQHLIR